MSQERPEKSATEASPLGKVNKLVESHGAIQPGKGILSGVIALALGMLAVLSVLAMRFPAYLTTPEFRHVYDVTTLRYLLFGGMVIAGALALTNIVLGRARYLSAWAFGFLTVALLMGGPGTPIEDFPDHTPYVGLDFFVLDLLGSTPVFVFIGKLFPPRKDHPLLRPEQRLLGGVVEHADDQRVEAPRSPFDDVDVTVRDGVERPRTQGGQAHLNLPEYEDEGVAVGQSPRGKPV